MYFLCDLGELILSISAVELHKQSGGVEMADEVLCSGL